MKNFQNIKKGFFKKENFYFFIIITLLFIIDRYSKNEILNNYSNNILYLNDFVNFDLIWNTGIGFGLFNSKAPYVYNSITLLIFFVIFFLALYFFKSDKIDKTILSIIIGGAVGNFYDRLIFKAVPDFIDFHVGNFHWFTFNLADIFITLGIIAFLIKGFFIKDD